MPRWLGAISSTFPACRKTHRFVEKLGLPATRIPLHGRIEVDTPHVLVLPTYGGGRAVPDINSGGYVPRQVIAFSQ